MYVYKSMAESRVTNAHHIINSALTGSRSPAGPRRLRNSDAHKSASLFRRLSVSFRSASNQDPKAAKFAVLTPGHAGFPKRVKRSEGSDSGPVRKAPVSACVPLCAIFLGKPSVYTFARESERGPFCRRLRQELFCRVVPIDGSRGWVFVTAFERPLKSV